MISKILVPTDGSETARKAVRYAGDLAKQTGASIILLSVVDKEALLAKSIPAVASPSHIIEPIEDYLKMAAETYLRDAEKLCRRRGREVKRVIRSGHPVEEIIKEAKRSRADLIIMGSRGKGALRTAVLGSITFGVIHKNTRFPVLVTRK